MNATVVIPVPRGRDWNRARATNLPVGTPFVVAEFDEGEWAQALNQAVDVAQTEFVVLSAPDVWFEENALAFLAGDLTWDADVLWGPLVLVNGDTPVGTACEGVFCPHRLTRENYVNPVMCVRKSLFQKVGGMTSGFWDLQNRMLKAGGRFKYVPEGRVARDEPWEDLSPAPEPDDVLATFYHQATVGTAYWRCVLPARHLPGQVVFNAPARGDVDGKLAFLNHAGAAVFQYAGDQDHLVIARAMRDQGTRVLVEVDDDYTRWAREVMRRAGWHRYAKDNPNGYSVEVHRETCELADGVIVTTTRLAKLYQPLNPNVYVCPNQIDPIDWPELEKPDDGVFRIGWFASASHRGDSELIMRALEWASRQPGVEVNIIGIGRHPSGKAMWPNLSYRHYAWSNDLGVYKRFLLNLDVGLAPVIGNPWALCRSDLKALEYVMAGALPVVSDREPYAGTEMPGMMRCPDAKAFLRAVQWCVANKEEVKALAGEARDHVLAERTVQANIGRWQEAVQE